MSSEALAKPTITKNSSEFKLDVYASISTGELVVFAVQVLQADAAPVAVEEIVSTCFRFFPHSFALKNYFYWPDSALVTRRLHDAKEKGLLKGNSTDGYETKGSGRQVAKQVAKTLSVSLPVPPKVEVVIAPPVVEKKEEEKKEVTPSVPAEKVVEKQGTKKKVVQQKQKAAKPEKKAAPKKQAVKPKVQTKPKKADTKVAVPVKKKVVKKEERRKTVKPLEKAKVQVKQKQSTPAPKPKATAKKVEKKEERRKKEAVKAAPKPKVVKQEVQKQEIKKKETKAVAKPTQLTLGLTPPPTAWKKAEAPVAKPKVKEEAKQPGKVEVLPAVVVSKEEKDKAAKVVKQIERSDAYQLYRRNGRRAQIGEFDFRNMLFATMESSAETLKRNVELFKRYAGIHFRTDLIAFLEFCEESFSALLISKVKGKK